MLPSTPSAVASSALSPPLPPTAPLHNPALITAARQPENSTTDGGPGLSPSILKISGIIAFVIVLSASIHFLLRYVSHRNRRRRAVRPSSSSTASSPLRNLSSLSFSSDSSRSSHADGNGTDNTSAGPDPDQLAVIESLPLFTLASATASSAPPRSTSADCAVCLSRFDPDEDLRMLPACGHAFHSACIDAWLRSTMSCPLCRSAVFPIHKPDDDVMSLTPPHRQPGALPSADRPRSGSFRLEIGSVSRRTTDSTTTSSSVTTAALSSSDLPPLPVPYSPPPPHARSYSLGSSFEYVVKDEIAAVVAAVAAHVRRNSSIPAPHPKHPHSHSSAPATSSLAALPPGDSVAEAAGDSRCGWLKDYVDRLASSASSSFSSLRFSGRWSRRSDGGGGTGGGSWDLEGVAGAFAATNCSSTTMARTGGEETSSSAQQQPYYSFYRWLVGAV